MQTAALFSEDYGTARARFLDAARAAGADLRSHVMAAAGPAGERLFLDEARLGPARASSTVIVSSALHGVEGLPGSAIQLAWLTERAARMPLDARVRVVLVHALNPFGFAWQRRANEHNVDLNRNFLSDRFDPNDAAATCSRQVYDRLSGFLNPPSPPTLLEPYLIRAGMLAIREGLQTLQRVLPVGQYHQPNGLFFGGHRPEETTRVVRERIAQWTAGATLAIHLDIHSGLGPWAGCQLLTADEAGSPRAAWAAERLGPAVVAAGGRSAYRARGTMAEDLVARALPCEYYGFTMEFGTYSGVRVLGALRAENRAYFFAPAEARVRRRASRRLLHTFVPRAPAWRDAVVRTGVLMIDRALEVGRSPR